MVEAENQGRPWGRTRRKAQDKSAPPAERQETREKRDGKRQAHGQAPQTFIASYKILTDLGTQSRPRAVDADARVISQRRKNAHGHVDL